MSEMETLRVDAGEPYLWRVGDVTVLTALRVHDRSDDVRVDMTLQVERAEDAPTPVRRSALLGLDPWKVAWDPGDKLPEPLNDEHLTSLLTKHREEVTWRAGKLLRSRDRERWRHEDLSGYEKGVMVRYRNLFPDDFDLVRYLDGRAYFLEDYHCLEPNCSCSSVTLSVTALDDDGGDHQDLGHATFELLAPRLKPTGTKAATTVVRKIMKERIMQERVAKRHAECRRIAPALAAALGRVPKTVTVGKKPGRNDPCSCGSGKKYKKCCLR